MHLITCMAHMYSWCMMLVQVDLVAARTLLTKMLTDLNLTELIIISPDLTS